tara:strand:+ start:469 stop:1392 length:924 start_codon:yes stop_codon:yes gene_type:complete
MASQAIKNLQNLVVDKVITEARFRIKEEAYKQIQKIREMIPTKDEIKKMIIDAILDEACSIPAQRKLTQLYNSIHTLMEKIEGLLQKGLDALVKIETKLRELETNVLVKIDNILQKLNPFIIAMRIIIQIAPTSLAASSGPAASGIVIDQLGRKIDIAVIYIAFYGELILSYIDMIPMYIERILKIVDIISIAINKIKGILAMVTGLKAYLEYLFLQFLSHCNTVNSDATDDEGNINIENSIDNILNNNSVGDIDGDFADISNMMTMNYQNLLDDLKIDGKTEILEIIKNQKFGFNTQYKVLTVPIP